MNRLFLAFGEEHVLFRLHKLSDWKKQNSRSRYLIFPIALSSRYVWGNVPLYELILSLKPNSYLTHYTAVYFHDLTEQVPKTIYINVEQERKPRPKNALVQERIDAHSNVLLGCRIMSQSIKVGLFVC